MRRHEELEFAVAELEQHNIKYATRPTDGGHIEIIWQVSPDKEVRRVFTSKTPSDHRTRLNARAFIRRALRQDGVDIDSKHISPPKKQPAALEKALQVPRQGPTIPEQLEALRSDVADVADLLLDVLNLISELKGIQNAQPVVIQPTSVVPSYSPPKTSVRSKKAIDYVSAGWNSLEALARDMDLPVNITYRKLYYLKNQGLVELKGGRCRLVPKEITAPQSLIETLPNFLEQTPPPEVEIEAVSTEVPHEITETPSPEVVAVPMSEMVPAKKKHSPKEEQASRTKKASSTKTPSKVSLEKETDGTDSRVSKEGERKTNGHSGHQII